MAHAISLESYGIENGQVLRNLTAAELYEHAVMHDGANIARTAPSASTRARRRDAARKTNVS